MSLPRRDRSQGRPRKTRTTKLFFPFGFVMVLALVATACSGGTGSGAPQTAESPQAGGSITVGTGQWRTLDPLQGALPQEEMVFNVIYDPLLRRTAGGIEPGLAKSYEVSEDRTRITLRLRKGVDFHNSASLNAEAVKANLDRYRNPENGCLCASRFSAVQSVKAADKHTVVVDLSEPAARPVLSSLASETAMVAPSVLDGGDITKPVGTGPFEVGSYTPGAALTVQKFERYWKQERPYLDQITFKAMPDRQTRFASLRSGAIQIATNLKDRQVQQAESVRNVRVVTTPSYGTTFVMFNMTKSPFDQRKARRAVCAASDPGALNEALNYGMGNTSVHSPWPPAHPYHSKNAPSTAVDHDLAQAKSLVKELGGLQFTLSVSRDQAGVAQALQGQWVKAGMQVEVETLGTAALTKEGVEMTYAATFRDDFGTFDPDPLVSVFYQSESAGNLSGIDDARVDRLVEQGRRAPSEAERQRIYRELANRLAELTPVCYLWAPVHSVGTSPEVQGISLLKDGLVRLDGAYLKE